MPQYVARKASEAFTVNVRMCVDRNWGKCVVADRLENSRSAYLKYSLRSNGKQMRGLGSHTVMTYHTR